MLIMAHGVGMGGGGGVQGFSPGAASPTEIGRRLADRPGLWFLPFLLLLAL